MLGIYRDGLIKQINIELSVIGKDDVVAVWGISEYAVNIQVYTDLNKIKVSYYIDNDKAGDLFNGMYICSPESVDWTGIDVVIILAYYAHNEIEKTLHNKYNYKGILLKPGIGLADREFYNYDAYSINSVPEKYRNVLEKNKIYKNIYKNRRCFILGNGPSLKEYDLKKIDGEVIFAVNRFFRANIDITLSHYCIADSLFLKDEFYDSFGKEFASELKKYCVSTSASLWFPVDQMDIVKEKFDNWENVFYFYPGRTFEKRVNEDIDLSKRIPATYSVVQYCIFMAIYMGIKEIYLLGCEETGLLGALENYLDNGYSEYAFQIPKNELKVIKEYNSKITQIEDLLFGFSRIFRGYKDIKKFCVSNDVAIYTCASKGLIKNLDFIDFKSIT